MKCRNYTKKISIDAYIRLCLKPFLDDAKVYKK